MENWALCTTFHCTFEDHSCPLLVRAVCTSEPAACKCAVRGCAGGRVHCQRCRHPHLRRSGHICMRLRSVLAIMVCCRCPQLAQLPLIVLTLARLSRTLARTIAAMGQKGSRKWASTCAPHSAKKGRACTHASSTSMQTRLRTCLHTCAHVCRQLQNL